jgi:hypothetical protein
LTHRMYCLVDEVAKLVTLSYHMKNRILLQAVVTEIILSILNTCNTNTETVH